jgi:hypothetical protein
LRDRGGTNGPTCAGAVFNHDGLAKARLQALRQGAGDYVV